MSAEKGLPPELLRPGLFPSHQTAGAYLLAHGKLLLEKRPDDARSYAGYWDTPGGHIEASESPEQALLRELKEELDITLRSYFLAAVRDHQEPSSQRLYRHHFYVAKEWEGTLRPCEGQELRWFAIAEVRKLQGLNPLIAEVLEDLLRRAWLLP